MTWKRALVTGASSGIGRAMAVDLAGRGTHLVLVARSGDALQELATDLGEAHGIEAEAFAADLTDAGELAKIEGRVRDLDRPVDLVVNNAGFGAFGRFHEADVDVEEAMIALNVIALTRLTHAAAAVMVARGEGAILNVSSVAGFQPVPHNATYAATKAYVTSFTEAVHEELRGTGVHATVLCPGFTDTGFTDAADVRHAASRIPDAAWMSAANVARAGLEGAAKGRAVVIPGIGNKLSAAASTLLPKTAVRRTLGAVMNRVQP